MGDLSDSPRGRTCLTAVFVSKPATLLDVSIAAVFKLMMVHHQLGGLVVKKGIAIH
jgi:hypothetical protein